jgi:CheY-like chemotaxis protein
MVNNILVIDDDPAVRGAFKLILKSEMAAITTQNVGTGAQTVIV